MPDKTACLGLCFFGNQFFYAIGNNGQHGHLKRIGAIDFNFDIARALFENEQQQIEGLRSSIDDLIEQFNASHLRMLLYPTMECWAILPKLVYDNAEEREAYINILLNGSKRKHIHPSWHALSKDNFKLLLLRTDHTLQGIQTLTEGLANIEYASAFEIGEHWINHVKPGGSFLTVNVFDRSISVCSYILGKLRGATYIEFDDPDDLPYLWLQKARDLSWMKGLHEQIQVYGREAHKIIEILEPFWDDAGTVTNMNTLDKMQVRAEEDTYGFELSLAFPAVMLALN